MQITYKIEKLKTGGFMAYCPDMKPVIVQGNTEEEISKKIVSVAKLYIKRHPDFQESMRSSDLVYQG